MPSLRRVSHHGAATKGLYNTVMMVVQTPPPSIGTADSGYFDISIEDDAVTSRSGGVTQPRTSNGSRNRKDAEAAELDRRLMIAAEESRRQVEEEARVQQQEQIELRRAVEQSIIAEQEAAVRRSEEVRENEVIFESLRFSEDEALRRRAEVEMDLAIVNSVIEAQESDRLRAMEANRKLDLQRVGKGAKRSYAASSLRIIEAAQALIIPEAENEQREECVVQAAEKARTRQEKKGRNMRISDQRSISKAATVFKEKEQEELDLALALSLEETEEREVEDSRFLRALPGSRDHDDIQPFMEYKRLQGRKERSQTASAPQPEYSNSVSSVVRGGEHGDQGDISEQSTQFSSRSQEKESADEKIFDSHANIMRIQDQIVRPISDVHEQVLSLPLPVALSEWNVETRRSSDSSTKWRTLAQQSLGPEVTLDRTLTPLPAPLARHGPLPTWLEHPEQQLEQSLLRANSNADNLPSQSSGHQSDTMSSGRSTRQSSKLSSHPSSFSSASPQGDFGDPFFEPAKQSRNSNVVVAAFLPIHEGLAVPQGSITRVATPGPPRTGFTTVPHTVNIYGPVTVNNNTINVGVSPGKTGSLLKRVLSQSARMTRGKTSGLAAVTNAARDQTEQIVSGIRSSLDSLNLGKLHSNGRYVSAADFEPRPIDEAYDSPSRPQSTNWAMLASLNATQARLQKRSEQSLQQARIDENGSPTSLRPQPLRVMNASTRSPLTPLSIAARPSPPPRSSSSLYGWPSPVIGAYVPPSKQASVPEYKGIRDCAPSQFIVGQDAQTPSSSHLRRPLNETLEQQTLHPNVTIPPPSSSITRRPVSKAFRKHTVPTRPADRVATDSPDSMRVENDSPSYTLHALGRKHIHPPVNTAWGNVPTAYQDLAFTNSRAMMGANRFGDSQTAMPVLSSQPGDVVQLAVDRTVTPNTRARKQEKDNQKQLRGRV